MSDAHDHAHEGLQVSVEETGPCIASVSFTVDAKEYARTRDQRLRGIAKNSRMKGFRPGKTPRAVLEKQFGEEVDRETLQHFLNHAYERAVKENELRPVVHPRVSLDEVEVRSGEDIKHTFELWLRPRIELGEYKGLVVEGRPTSVTDEELEEAMLEVRRQNSRVEEAGEAGLDPEGMAICKVTFEAEGIEEPVFEREGLQISPKSAPAGVEAEAFLEGMTGVAQGETREFPLQIPEGFPNEAAQGKPGTCHILVDKVLRVVPPTDEELFKGFEVEDQEALREAVRARFQGAKEEAEAQRIEGALLDLLIENHPMELPEPLLVAQAESKVEEMQQALTEQGFPPEEMQARLDEERNGAMTNSAKAMRAIYLMEEVAKAEALQVSPEDVEAELTGIAARNQSNVDQVRNYYQQEGLVQQLAMELLERKVRSFLRASADIRIVE